MNDSDRDFRPPPANEVPLWVSAALLIAGITVVARLLGLARFFVLAQTVGTTDLGDVYATANAVPNIVYEVVIGGALVAVVVPLVARAREQDPQQVRPLIAGLHGWALMLLVPITALMYVGSAWVIEFLLGSSKASTPQATSVATEMLWVFLLQIPVYGATVVAQGALQAHRRFLAPAIAPAISSVVVIASFLVYAQMAGESQGDLAALTTAEFWVLAGGTTAGVVALLLAQLPALVRSRLIVFPTLRFPTGQVARFRTLALSGAVVVGSQWLAYACAIRWSNVFGDEGSALVFVLAWTLFLLPWSILALPIATSTFPQLTELHARGDREGSARVTATSLRAVIAVSAAGAAGVAAASEPLAVVMVQGTKGVDAVPELSAMLLALAPGVLAYGVHGHLVRVLAARHLAPAAAAGTAFGWFVGLVVAWFGVTSVTGAVGVATAIGAGFSVGVAVAALLLVGAVVRHDGRAAMKRVPQVTLVVGIAAVVVGVGLHLWLSSGAGESRTIAAVQVVVAGALALLVVGGAATVVDPGAIGLLRKLRLVPKKVTRDE